jgi:hypothetical protein
MSPNMFSVTTTSNPPGLVTGLAEKDHLETALAAEQMGALPKDAIAQLRELYGRNFLDFS